MEILHKNIPTKALVVDKPGAPFVLTDVILDEVRDNEVLVEMRFTGLCHTDVVVQHGGMPVGEYPAILGHEGAGVVRKVGHGVKDKSLKPGDTVLMSFSSCRNCDFCDHDMNGTCRDITAINFKGVRLADKSNPATTLEGTPVRSKFFGQSSFSKFSVVSETSIVKCDLTDDELAIMAPMGCGYYTGAGTVMNVLKPEKSTTFAIIGMGAVGLSALMAAKALGVTRIIAVDVLDAKLQLAKSFGATDVINTGSAQDLSGAMMALLPGGVDQVMDTTGLSFLIEHGIRALSHGGTFVLVGVPRPGSSVSFDPLDALLGCKKIIGVIEAASNPAKVIPELIKLQQQGLFPVDRLSKVYSVSALDEALEDLKAGKIVKPVLSWSNL